MIVDHVAEFPREPLEQIISGARRIDARFAKTKQPPYGCVRPEDTVYLTMKNGYTIAKATVDKVKTYANLTPQKVSNLLETYKSDLALPSVMYERVIYSKYATLIWLKNLYEIRPFRVPRTNDELSSWRVVENINLLRTL
jgi:hypothetical protein